MTTKHFVRFSPKRFSRFQLADFKLEFTIRDQPTHMMGGVHFSNETERQAKTCGKIVKNHFFNTDFAGTTRLNPSHPHQPPGILMILPQINIRSSQMKMFQFIILIKKWNCRVERPVQRVPVGFYQAPNGGGVARISLRKRAVRSVGRYRASPCRIPYAVTWCATANRMHRSEQIRLIETVNMYDQALPITYRNTKNRFAMKNHLSLDYLSNNPAALHYCHAIPGTGSPTHFQESHYA